jgi:hypothetical protein
LRCFTALDFRESKQRRGVRDGRIGASQVTITDGVLPFEFNDPADVVSLIEDNRDRNLQAEAREGKDGEGEPATTTTRPPA